MDVDPSSSAETSAYTEASNQYEQNPNSLQETFSMMRPPPSINSSEGDGPRSDLPSSSLDMQTFKGHLELEMKAMQRKFQEVKNASSLSSQRSDAAFGELQVLKRNISKLESKLGPLQKMVASQTDKNIAFKKELTDTDTANKLQINEMRQKTEEFQREFSEVRRKIETLENKVESNSRSGGSAPSGTAMPENLMQMIDAFERQLGMYDVRIAEMDLRFQVLENTSYSGVLVWKIKDYNRRKREAITGRNLSLYSQPFYTSRYGYKTCARIYLNGDGMGKGTHLSLFFVVMKGDYDALLPWPFRQKVTLILLDQGADRKHLTDTFRPDPSSSSFKRPTSDMNIASGCPLFVAHNVIDGSSYVKDDTIFVRIQVDTSDLENF